MKARFTLYHCVSTEDGMLLRSGKRLNCVDNTPMVKDIRALTRLDNDIYNTQHLYHCPKCKLVLDFLDMLEKYHKYIREGKIWRNFYDMCRVKLAEFIRDFDNVIFDCYCTDSNRHFNGALERELEELTFLASTEEISRMANYTGYEDRRLYRIYNKNFLMLENTLTYSYGDYEEYSDVIVRDFDLMEAELKHWFKYFNRPHESVVKETFKALENRQKKVSINSDCIENILSYL
jgi:ribosomal protein S8